MNLASIDLNLLIVFDALMRERNVTRAAHSIGLSQPAMSNALHRLRTTFDDQLFIRKSSGMIPTPIARSMFSSIHPALEKLRETLESPPEFDPATSDHTFHIIASDYAEVLLVTRLASLLKLNQDNISLRLHHPTSLFQPPDARDLADTYDLAVGFYPEPTALDPALRSISLWDDRNIVIASRRHPTIKQKITAKMYAEAHHVAVFFKTEGAGLIDTLLAQQGLRRHQSVLVPDFSSVPHIVSGSHLIATIPERFAKLYTHLNLRFLNVPIVMPPFRLAALWHERRESDAAHRWLREKLTQLSNTRLSTGA
jgi:DNA-binding transcriptional LysR family regulator